MLPIHHWRTSYFMSRWQKVMWRSRVSIPVPADCEPTALPSELHPRDRFGRAKSEVQAMGFEPMPLARLAPKASALTTRPNLQPYDNQVGGAQTLRWRAKTNKKWSYHKVPGGTRTPNPQIRSLMRYPLRHKDELGAKWNYTQKIVDNSGI